MLQGLTSLKFTENLKLQKNLNVTLTRKGKATPSVYFFECLINTADGQNPTKPVKLVLYPMIYGDSSKVLQDRTANNSVNVSFLEFTPSPLRRGMDFLTIVHHCASLCTSTSCKNQHRMPNIHQFWMVFLFVDVAMLA